MIKPPIVEVTWRDCCSVPGWSSLGDALDTTLMECTSIGYLLDKGEESVILAQTLADQGDVGDIACIPTSTILEMREVMPYVKGT